MTTLGEEVDDFLAHYGVKGMKWGVRKAPIRVKVGTETVPGRRIKTTGGTGQRASADAVRAAVYKQKAKKSTTDALSDKELRALINRMQMEKQYNDLRPKPFYAGAVKFILGQAEQTGKNTVRDATNDYARKKVATVMPK